MLAHVSDLDALYYLTYANAALTVLVTTLLTAHQQTQYQAAAELLLRQTI